MCMQTKLTGRRYVLLELGILVMALASYVAVLAGEENAIAPLAASSRIGASTSRSNLPIDAEALVGGTTTVSHHQIRNLVTPEQIWTAVRNRRRGLKLSFWRLTRLLDGSDINPEDIYGMAYFGPYPFESRQAGYAYKRFRFGAEIAAGKADLELGALLSGKTNSEGWSDGGRIALRVELYLKRAGADRALGVYDTFVSFRRTSDGFKKLPTLIEGPLVHMTGSENPTQVVISFITSEPVETSVYLLGDDVQQFRGNADRRKQKIALTGLRPAGEYRYRVRVGRSLTKVFRFKTPPEAGSGTVTFAYCGDSREGVCGGMQKFMGINYATLERNAALAFTKGADFFIFGGDLVNGYTTSKKDFQMQLQAWKQAMSGFWNYRPVYPAMGNHEALLAAFWPKDGKRGRWPISIDRWPYATESAEAVFADAFCNPANGPKPSDPKRPPYRENVFSFRYGSVKVIAFNNNYWYSSSPEKFGGCPEGYILPDQMKWIIRQIRQAEKNPMVKYVFLYAQEPVFPCGGHIKDSMWYRGDNNIRAYSFEGHKLRPLKRGIIEVRNDLVRAVGSSSKVVAVLGSDEHAYYRLRVDRTVPVGVPSKDDRNNDGRIDWSKDEPASPLELKHPVWFITSGGGGAPYYSEQPTPWNKYWKWKDSGRKNYFYTSQENVAVFRANAQGVSLQVYNPYGEVIDRVEDLTLIKNGR